MLYLLVVDIQVGLLGWGQGAGFVEKQPVGDIEQQQEKDKLHDR